MKAEEIGSYAFIAGVIVAVIAAFVNAISTTLATEALVVLGLVVGLINITEKETTQFLVATVSLVIVSSLAGTGISDVPLIGRQLQEVLTNVVTFVTPAVVIVALKQIYAVAKSA